MEILFWLDRPGGATLAEVLADEAVENAHYLSEMDWMNDQTIPVEIQVKWPGGFPDVSRIKDWDEERLRAEIYKIYPFPRPTGVSDDEWFSEAVRKATEQMFYHQCPPDGASDEECAAIFRARDARIKARQWRIRMGEGALLFPKQTERVVEQYFKPALRIAREIADSWLEAWALLALAVSPIKFTSIDPSAYAKKALQIFERIGESAGADSARRFLSRNPDAQ